MSGSERVEYSSELYTSGTEDEEFVPPHSPTDSSEDSVEVKVNPISLRSKRKGSEPRKLNNSTFAPPPKKRMCLKIIEEQKNSREPFRPWNVADKKRDSSPKIAQELSNNSNLLSPILISPYLNHINLHVPVPYKPDVPISVPSLTQPIPVKEELTSPSSARLSSPAQPLSLVKKSSSNGSASTTPREMQQKSLSKPKLDTTSMRVPYHPQVVSCGVADPENALKQSSEVFPNLKIPAQDATYNRLGDLTQATISVRNFDSQNDSNAKKEQRNYKNMTRERRIEANARERTRVHTISAAFDTLRRSIPSYSHNQKLSKLSVLRIACSYIATLTNIVSEPGQCESSLEECVENVTRTIQKEGKLRKKKDESD